MALEMKGMTDCGIRVTFNHVDAGWNEIERVYQSWFVGHGFHVASSYRPDDGSAAERARFDLATLEAAGLVPFTVRVKDADCGWCFHPGIGR